MPTLVELLGCYGLCFGVQHKVPYIQYWSEWTDELLQCSYCVGFHCGWVLWIVTSLVNGTPPKTPVAALEPLLWSFTSAAFCYVLDSVVKWVESQTG